MVFQPPIERIADQRLFFHLHTTTNISQFFVHALQIAFIVVCDAVFSAYSVQNSHTMTALVKITTFSFSIFFAFSITLTQTLVFVGSSVSATNRLISIRTLKARISLFFLFSLFFAFSEVQKFVFSTR